MQIIDALAAMSFGFLSFLWNPPQLPFVAAFLGAIIVLTGDLLFFFDPMARWRMMGFLAAGIFVPDFCLFVPALVCKAVRTRQWVFVGAGLLLSAVQYLNGVIPAGCLAGIVLGSAVAAAMVWKSLQIEALRRELFTSIDSSRENSILMEEKNRVLRDKQDYEINNATLQERNRIAREIHDNVGHLLSRSILLSGAIQAINRDEGLREPLRNLDESLNTAMTSIRYSVHDLHDEAMDLEHAVRDLLKDFTFCPVTLRYDMGRILPKSVKYCYLAILKEALNNIIRHSDATKVEILMREQPAMYQLSVRDNGTPAGICNTGIGLSNMKERVQELGGYFKIRQEQGFQIFITIPKERESSYKQED